MFVFENWFKVCFSNAKWAVLVWVKVYIQLLRERFCESINDEEITKGMCINLFETTQHNNGRKGTEVYCTFECVRNLFLQ